jgi:type VI secretion system protein ImpM
VNPFWTPQQTALLHVGPPHIGSLREILAPTGSAEHVAELCGIPTFDEATARTRLRPQLASSVEKVEQPIADFLASLGQ